MNLLEIGKMTESEARKLLEGIRWPNSVRCAHCGSEKVTKLEGDKHRDGVYQCNETACREQFTVTVGTILHKSKIPLVKWVMAFHLLCSSKKGISAHQLYRQLGLGSYKTAWHLCHRIRWAMCNGEDKVLLGLNGGIVEADETYIGGKPPEYFSETAIRSAKNLADAVGTTEDDDTSLKLLFNQSTTQITHHISANIIDMFKAAYEDYGSIEGRVNLISDKGQLKFDVHDDLYDKDIHCIAKDEHLEIFMQAFRKRVEVYGMIRYRRDGVPNNIVVERVEIFPAPEDLPSFDDVRGILRGLL